MLGSLASPSSSSLEGTNKAEQHVNLKSRSLHSASHKQQPQQPIYSKGKLADSRYAKSYTHPSVTLKDLRDAVPSHCFERNMVTSFTHLFKDLVMAAFLVLANYQIQSFLSHGQDQFWSFILSGLAWCFYWVAQGIICTGIWVLAHECGHGAFTKSSLVNNVTGYILHTALLVPFFSWKYTHSKHHKGTNHMLKDQVYVPLTRSRIEKANGLSPSSTPFSSSETTTTNPFEHESDSLLEDAPLTYLFNLAAMLLLGWPLYLVLNKASQKNRKGAWTNHFNPNAFIFEDNERFFVALSSVGVLGMLCLLSWCGVRFGFGNVIVWYGIPYLWVNAWLVLITYLQHSDPRVPKYRGKVCIRYHILRCIVLFNF